MYTFDTNAIIYYLKDDPSAVVLLKALIEQTITLYASSISEIELFSYPNLSDKEEQQIEAILSTLSIIPLDSRIARLAGTIRRFYRITVTDSAIAATALFTGSTLVTRNVRDFQKITGLPTQKI